MIYDGTCLVCSTPFQWDSANKGRKRRFCSPECARRRYRVTTGLPCAVPDCPRPAVTKGRLCMACYHRNRRNGTTVHVRPRRLEAKTTHKGYVTLYRPTHPLAKQRGGRVMEHRVVLYEKLGEGAHPCFWCGATLQWKAIRVDHLNENKGDNNPDNLVASCNRCNRARGQFLPFVAGLSATSLEAFIARVREYHATAREDGGFGNLRRRA